MRSREMSLPIPQPIFGLGQTVTGFLAGLRETAKTLDVSERQRIVRLSVTKLSWLMTRLSFDTQSQRRPAHSRAVNRLLAAKASRSVAEVAFCVRGVVAAPLVGVFHKQCEDAVVSRISGSKG
jgi:hypothetical protein